MTYIEIGDTVEVNDPFSMNHECQGKVVEELPNGIFKVLFLNWVSSYHESKHLINLKNPA